MFRKLSLIDRILFPINVLVVLLLLLSFSAQFLDPKNFWFIALTGLAFPGFAILNVSFALYWMMKLKPHFILSASAVILVISSIPKHFQVSESKDDFDLKLGSFNVQVFDHYYWKKDSTKRQNIYQLLREEQFDIICFQEYFESRRPYYKQFTDSLHQSLSLEHYHKEFAVDFYGNLFGLASFSRFPIINKGKVKMENQGTNICIYTDLVKNGDTFRLYNMHLASLHLKPENYELLDNFDKGFEDKNLKAFKNTLIRLREAYKRRREQVNSIAEHIQSSPYPVIVCGDFNDGPESYSYRRIAEGLSDAFVEAGNGFGNTYNGRLPALRIDYILYSPIFIAAKHRVINRQLSDHFPIMAGLNLRDAPSEPADSLLLQHGSGQ